MNITIAPPHATAPAPSSPPFHRRSTPVLMNVFVHSSIVFLRGLARNRFATKDAGAPAFSSASARNAAKCGAAFAHAAATYGSHASARYFP